MQIYLLRHGIAEDGRPGQHDAERGLTPEGVKKLRAILQRARDGGVEPSLVLTSPYRRAVQSAELAARALGYKGELLRTKALQPDASVRDAWEEIRLHRDAAQMLLAGHEPLFSALTAHLLGCPSLIVDFKKGAIVRVDMDSLGPHPRGVLRWLLAPKLARAD
jgi:phosphohistidine phosphatase